MISEKEKQIVDFITYFEASKQCSPSIKSIAKSLNVHRSTVRRRMAPLISKGIIKHTRDSVTVLRAKDDT